MGNSLVEKRVIVATREIAPALPSCGHVALSIHIRDQGLQLTMIRRVRVGLRGHALALKMNWTQSAIGVSVIRVREGI